MLRNDLITALAQHDNDTVTLKVSGRLVDIETVTTTNGCIAIIGRTPGLAGTDGAHEDMSAPRVPAGPHG